MGEEVKKVSFGFSKLIKKTNIVSGKLAQPKPEDKKVEFIDCVESNTIKLKDHVEPAERLLVIPMRNQLQVPSVIGQDQKTDNTQSQIRSLISSGDHQENEIHKPSKTDIADMDPSVENNIDRLKLLVNNDTSPDSNSTTNNSLTLDEIAAKEILEDLKRKSKFSDKPTLNLSVPISNNTPDGQKESSLEDYENIPVTEFGMAMLRGMGWAPGKGIGKNEKLVTPSLPTLRPKGMGLGADKVVKDATVSGNKITTEDLKMVKGSFIRVIVGSYKDSYGQIEGFDDESGRLIIKLALGNMTISLNEFMVQLVGKVEFTKNSKVLNVSKYEQYKDEEDKLDSEKSKDKSKYEKERLKKHSSSETYTSRPNLKYSKSGKSSIKNNFSSESELPDSGTPSIEVEKLSTSRKSRGKSYKARHGSSSKSPDDNHRKICSPIHKSQSKSSNSGFNSNREASTKKKKSSHISRSATGRRDSSNSWHSSSSSSRTSSSSDYIRRKHRRKKPSSHKSKSRSRSRTPRKHNKSTKHKKSKYN